ncbi:hypothetical protein [Endozoicomonas lisbonensis]|uniref:hypothetical protein n=1 Tax=Endozoicomonas lisbonensis TaxID=3120522 RepID=UPI003396B01F
MSKKTARVYVSKDGGEPVKAGVLINVSEISVNKQREEDDDMESVESGFARKTSGLKNVDDITMIIRYDDSDDGQKLMWESYNDDVEIGVEVRYPDDAKTCMKVMGEIDNITINGQDVSTKRMEGSFKVSVNGGLTKTTWAAAQ